MGKRGPIPKPKAALVRSGSNQIYNRKDDLEVPVGMPDRPEWLDEVGCEVWDETVKKLYNLGVITVIDKGALSLYCHSWSQFLRLESMNYKFILTSKTGVKKQNPAFEASNKAWEKILKISKELGLTPASRAGLAPGGAKREADKSSSRFFKGAV